MTLEELRQRDLDAMKRLPLGHVPYNASLADTPYSSGDDRLDRGLPPVTSTERQQETNGSKDDLDYRDVEY